MNPVDIGLPDDQLQKIELNQEHLTRDFIFCNHHRETATPAAKPAKTDAEHYLERGATGYATHHQTYTKETKTSRTTHRQSIHEAALDHSPETNSLNMHPHQGKELWLTRPKTLCLTRICNGESAEGHLGLETKATP
ncbi:hypothetical protein F2Q70_00026937 [Brassica cretica]|uniref:Uncharacterized protein n=1 Tax=Brassica cretica TaxID=69181 RepID=A0A3N6QTI4_BRACR|nr:hypothetical protein F2Q70_00026937 [Brassica cretica]KAF3577573.1 hypothetical protein DY000_02032841 [Brassica cretica]